jgi:hypothetical protein
MNTLLSPRTAPPPAAARSSGPARRVGPLDRLALHVGLALVTWGRRPGPLPASRERRASQVELRLAQFEREQSAERQALLSRPMV